MDQFAAIKPPYVWSPVKWRDFCSSRAAVMTVEVTDDKSDRGRHADGGEEHRRDGREGRRSVLNKVLAGHQHSSLS